MKNDFYVYLHRKASNNYPFYVGKGRGRRASNTHGRSELWNRTYKKHGLNIEILFSGLTEQEAFDIEVETIEFLKEEGVVLCNRTNGGDGITGHRHSPETREAIRRAHKGKKQPLELVQKRAAANRGRKQPRDAVERTAASHRGTKASAETRLKMSIVRKGRKPSPETIKKVADWHRGKKRSAEARQKMSDSQPNKREVKCIDNGIVFDSIENAAVWLRDNGSSKATRTGIWFCLTGKRNKSYGYKWEYLQAG